MPQTLETVQPIAELLENVAVKYRNPAYILEDVLPVVNVARARFSYFIFGGDAFRRYNTKRAFSTAPIRIDYTFRTREGVCKQYMAEHAIDIYLREQQLRPLDLDVQAAEAVADAIRLDLEVDGAELLFDTGKYASGLTDVPSPKWNETGATIFENITDAQEKVRKRIGRYPNTILIPASVAQVLAFSSEVTDYIKNVIGLQRLERPPEQGWLLPATLFGMRVVIPASVQTVDGTTKDIWGDKVLIAYVSPRPGLWQPSLGYIFRLENYRVRTWHDEHIKSDIVECSVFQTPLITGVDEEDKIIAAFLWDDVLA